MNRLDALEFEPAELVALRGGVVVDAEAIAFGVALEARGVSLHVEDGELVLRPPDRVTEADVAGVRRHAGDLTRLVRYRPQGSRP